MWGQLKGSSLRRGGQGSAQGEPWSGGAAGGLPPGRNCRRRRASPATAPLAWKSPSPLALWSPARPLVATPDQNQPAGAGPCHPPRFPFQGRGELLCEPSSRGTPREAGGTWLWEHHSSPPRMLLQGLSGVIWQVVYWFKHGLSILVKHSIFQISFTPHCQLENTFWQISNKQIFYA